MTSIYRVKVIDRLRHLTAELFFGAVPDPAALRRALEAHPFCAHLEGRMSLATRYGAALDALEPEALAPGRHSNWQESVILEVEELALL